MPSHVSAAALIKRFEGFSCTPYRCPAGVWTIGYGHTAGVHAHTAPITEEEAEALLLRDMRGAEQVVDTWVKTPLNAHEKAALVSFVFNVGRAHFISSTLLTRLNAGEKAHAADELLRWVYASGAPLEGLKTRRMAERQIFLEPVV